MNATLTQAKPGPKSLEKVREFFRAEAPRLAEKYTLRVDGFFGSYARGEQTPESDVDVLVSFERVPGLIELIGIENDVSERLGVKVQMVHNDGSPFLKRIEDDLVPL